MRRAVLIGLATAVVGLGAGIGIGAAVWSGSSGSQSAAAPSRGFSETPKLEHKVTQATAPKNYDHGFTVWSRYKDVKFIPDDPRSTCGTPYELKATGWFMGGTGLWQYNGNAEINDSGSCFFKISYIFWNTSNKGSFGLSHSQGSWYCYENCRREGTVPYFVYTGS